VSSHGFGVVLLKVMGLYFALEAVLGVFGIVTSLTDPMDVPWVASFAAIAYQVMYVFVMAVFSGALLIATGRVAERLFPVGVDDSRVSMDARRALAVGIGILGVYLVATNLAAVVGFLGEFAWYLEGSRQDFVPDFWRSTWRDTVPKIGTALIGCILCLQSKPLSLFLSRSWDAKPD
jgi:hypothetical protein